MEFVVSNSDQTRIYFHDCLLEEFSEVSSEEDLLKLLTECIQERADELVNDQVIKNLIDYQQQQGESQYLHLIPEIIPVAKISRIYKALLAEEIYPLKFNLVLQVLSEYAEDKVELGDNNTLARLAS